MKSFKEYLKEEIDESKPLHFFAVAPKAMETSDKWKTVLKNTKEKEPENFMFSFNPPVTHEHRQIDPALKTQIIGYKDSDDIRNVNELYKKGKQLVGVYATVDSIVGLISDPDNSHSSINTKKKARNVSSFDTKSKMNLYQNFDGAFILDASKVRLVD